MKLTYEELERQLEESRREFRAADATIHNLELQLTELAVQLASAESKCRELAAENVALKQSELDFDEMAKSDYGPDWVSELTKTPATDAFLAEVRAQGVEMLAAEYESKIEPYKNHDEFMNAHYLKMQAIEARNFADKLRKGAAL